MKCFKCGAEAPAGNKFCPHCGASMSVGQPAGGMGQNQANPGQGGPNMQMQNPGQQNVGYQNPGYQNTGYQNPGYPNAGYQNPGYPVPGNAANSIATASMILGIVGDIIIVIGAIIGMSAERTVFGYGTGYYDDSTMVLGGFMAFVGMICGSIGFILSICSLVKKTTKKGIAITGLVCGSVSAALLTLFVIAIAFGM